MSFLLSIFIIDLPESQAGMLALLVTLVTLAQYRYDELVHWYITTMIPDDLQSTG